MKKNIHITGGTGRMGKELIKLLRHHPLFELHSVLARTSADGDKIKTYTSMASLPLNQINCIIDFSSPGALPEVLTWAVKNKTPIVSGTTGLGTEEFELIRKASQIIPVLWSPNMSLGIAVLSRMMKSLSALSEFDFQIEDVHHNKKKDSPSGTALHLQQVLEENVNRSLPPPVSIRGGGVFGIHKVWVMGEEEVLTLEHTAFQRSVFARGAITAAAWLIENSKPGLYTMDNVLAGRLKRI